MNKSISISRINYLGFPDSGIKQIIGSGFGALFVDMNTLYLGDYKTADEYLTARADAELYEKTAECLLDKFLSNGIKISAMRSPIICNNIGDKSTIDIKRGLAKKTIKLCNEYKCRFAVIPPVLNINENKYMLPENREYYLSLSEYASDKKVNLLIENVCRDHNKHYVRSVFSEAYLLSRFVDDLNKNSPQQIFGICMDTGNCNLCGVDMNEFSLSAGNRIKTVIMRENDCRNNLSFLPATSPGYPGKTDWLGLVRGLRSTGFDGELVVDISDSASSYSMLLMPQFLSLASSVADFFCWQIGMENLLKKYDKRVLFGAGNMCKNYMKYYGEKYPPLFTCDNNSSKWGSYAFGLEVKNPNELKKLTSDCAIFICNTFYNEIERQLKEMDIENPIEYFNDEYLPAFPY